MQIAFAVKAFKTRRHRQPQQKKQPPQDPGSHPEPGAPSVSLYFPETCRSEILSATQMSTNFKFSIRANRPMQNQSQKGRREEEQKSPPFAETAKGRAPSKSEAMTLPPGRSQHCVLG
jgi:hypothetical protein